MTQVEDGLILRVTSEKANQTERIVLAKSPVFRDEEEKKEGEEEMVDVPKILQPDEV
jgi:hypothetical protein